MNDFRTPAEKRIERLEAENEWLRSYIKTRLPLHQVAAVFELLDAELRACLAAKEVSGDNKD